MSKKEFRSDYIIDIKSNLKDIKIKKYIEKSVKSFLKKHEIYDYLLISPENQITHKDFKVVDFSYFYESIVFDFSKENDILNMKTKVCITFDKRLCNIYDDHTNRYYNTLSIGGSNVAYYILFTLDEIYEYIYYDV